MRSTQLTTILLIVPVLFLCSIFLMHHQQSLAENREIPIESTTIQSTTIDPKKEARDNCTNEKNAEWKNISLCVFENLVCEKAEVNLIDVCSKQGFGDFEEVCDCKEGFMRQFKGGKGDCVEQQECEQEQRKEKQCKDRQNTEWAKLDECMVIPTCNKQNPDLIPNCVKEPRMESDKSCAIESQCEDAKIKFIWKPRMLHNSFMGVFYQPIREEPNFHLGDTPGKTFDTRGVDIQRGMWEDAEMAYFFGLNQPANMLVRFNTTSDGMVFCEVGTIPEDVFKLNYKQWGNEHCRYKKKMYKHDDSTNKKHNLKVNLDKKYAFCGVDKMIGQQLPGVQVPKWMVANGDYNRPSKPVECLFDFYNIATETNEYNLFSYCAKAFFFNGKSLDEYLEAKKAADYFRKDWLLYLAEGRLSCTISGNHEEDRALLAKGYQVELVHTYDFYHYRFFAEMVDCPELRGTLVSYEDNSRDGKFFFAGVVGGAQLKGKFKRSYWGNKDEYRNKWVVKPKPFWNKKTYQDAYADMNLDGQVCYLHYHNLIKRYRKYNPFDHNSTVNANEAPSKRYNLQIRISHFCSERALRTVTTFDVPIGAEQVPNGVYEDKGIEINLNEKRLMRSTGQKLCAVGTKGTDCKVPEERPKTDLHRIAKDAESAELGHCGHNHFPHTRECPFGHRCHNLNQFCKMEPEHAGLTREHYQSLCQRFLQVFNNKRNFQCLQTTYNVQDNDDLRCWSDDQMCHDDEFCYFYGTDLAETTDEIESSGMNKTYCRKLRFRELGDSCFHSDECHPGAQCFRNGNSKWGVCRTMATYECPYHVLDWSGITYHPCSVDKCPRGSFQSPECAAFLYEHATKAGCHMRTYDQLKWNAPNVVVCAVDNFDDSSLGGIIKGIFKTIDNFFDKCPIGVGLFDILEGKPPLSCIMKFVSSTRYECCS